MTQTVVVTPPGEAVCPLPEAKAWLRVGHDSEDDAVAQAIAAATARVERETGLALVQRTLRLELARWDGAVIRLRPAPVTSLMAVEVVTEVGGRTEVTERFALEHGRPALVCRRPGQLPVVLAQGERIAVTFAAGFGAAADVPEDLVTAVKLVAGQIYARGEAAREETVEALAGLIAPWREVRL